MIEFNCPLPIGNRPKILMGHGGGGKWTQELIEKIFIKHLGNDYLDQRHDGAIFDIDANKLAFTTDSYVVRPLFFPGGNIGSLAVNGSVNDLAMCGARPLYLSLGLILEEGLEISVLQKIIEEIAKAAEIAQVKIITGDTKVVDKGKGDQIFINTSGIGVIEHNTRISPQEVQPGDAIILSGDIGRHGVVIMAARQGLEFDTTLESDCACIASPALELIEQGLAVHCLRDLTRGGLATSLIEIADSAGATIKIDEKAIPVLEQVQGACEILGLDPIYIANEGRFVAIVPEKQTEQAITILKKYHQCPTPTIIGKVVKGPSLVTIKSQIGIDRVVNMLSGEQLPRIC